MPLIILGLILLLGIVVYAIIRYMNSGDDDSRSVRERYPHAFPPRAHEKRPGDIAGQIIRYRRDRSGSSEPPEDSDIKHTEDGNIIFPTDNVEVEKNKRNIH